MRIYALAIAMALLAQPAWAHHKPNHRIHRPDRPAVMHITRDPCGVSNNPHASLGFSALERRCSGLRVELARNPDDAQLRERCDRLARALTGRTCNRTGGHR